MLPATRLRAEATIRRRPTHRGWVVRLLFPLVATMVVACGDSESVANTGGGEGAGGGGVVTGGSGGASDCVDGATQSQSCGLNGRGTQALLCDNGVWEALECVDPDECADGVAMAEDACSRACIEGHFSGDALSCDFVEVEAGGNHRCALTRGGEVYCHKASFYIGQIKTGFTHVDGLHDIVEVSVGGLNGTFSCAVVEGGQVKCFTHQSEEGDKWDGIVDDVPDATTISVGLWGYAVRESGRVVRWDRAGNTTEDLAGDMYVDDAVSVSAAQGVARPGCALHQDGDVSCWNTSGELGGWVSCHADVTGVHDAVAISVGDGNSCALRESGQVVCWEGSCGSPAAVPVTGLDDAVSVSVASEFGDHPSHACALRQGGQVVCWGGNADGQLGDGSFDDRDEPVEVVGLDDAIDVSVGAGFSCAVRENGFIDCWGEYFGNTPQRMHPASSE